MEPAGPESSRAERTGAEALSRCACASGVPQTSPRDVASVRRTASTSRGRKPGWVATAQCKKKKPKTPFP